MNSKLKKLKNYYNKNFWVKKLFFPPFLPALMSLLLVFNNKLFLIVFLFFGIFIFFYLKKNIWETIILTFFLSISFENPLRGWIYEVTTPLFNEVPVSGYYLYFGIYVKFILAIVLFLIAILTKKHMEIKTKSPEILLIILFFLTACLNTFFFTKGIVPILGLFRIWLAVWIFMLSRYYFTKNKQVFFTFIYSLFVFSIFLGMLQLINQKPLGRYIELTPTLYKETGYSTTDGQKQFRVTGFVSHPVYFASLLSMLYPIFLGYFLEKINNQSNPMKIISFCFFAIIGAIIIITTLSRSSFFTLSLSLFFLRKIIYQKVIKKCLLFMKENIFVKTILSVLIPIVFLCIVYYLYPRIESFGLLFKETGNASIRIELIKQSLKMILNNPWGVGLNNFTKNLIEYDLPANLLGFIVPVHNTFLIFFTELGIPGGIFFTFFIFYIFLKNFKKTEDSPALFGVWIGIFTFIINSQIHPLFNLDPTFDILMLILGFYSICQPQKT